jgi:hypothetical protein
VFTSVSVLHGNPTRPGLRVPEGSTTLEVDAIPVRPSSPEADPTCCAPVVRRQSRSFESHPALHVRTNRTVRHLARSQRRFHAAFIPSSFIKSQ